MQMTVTVQKSVKFMSCLVGMYRVNRQQERQRQHGTFCPVPISWEIKCASCRVKTPSSHSVVLRHPEMQWFIFIFEWSTYCQKGLSHNSWHTIVVLLTENLIPFVWQTFNLWEQFSFSLSHFRYSLLSLCSFESVTLSFHGSLSPSSFLSINPSLSLPELNSYHQATRKPFPGLALSCSSVLNYGLDGFHLRCYVAFVKIRSMCSVKCS